MRRPADRGRLFRGALYAALALGAVFLPVVLWQSGLKVLSFTFSKKFQIFELFGFCASAALFTAAVMEFKRPVNRARDRLVPLALFFVTAFHFLAYINDHSYKSWDYDRYEIAAKAVLAGGDPYMTDTGHATGYLYPPLTAQVFALVFRAGSFIGLAPQYNGGWFVVFYLFQAVQFLLLLLAFYLCFRLARRCGLSPVVSALLTTALLVFNSQVLRNLRFQNMNFLMLDAILAAMLLAGRRPYLAGAAAALGGSVKIYPLALLFPWTLKRRWRPVVWAVAASAALVLIQTGFGRGAEVWGRYLHFFSGVFPNYVWRERFGDNSIDNVLVNTLSLAGYMPYSDSALFAVAARALIKAVKAAAVVFFALRFFKAERLLKGQPGRDGSGEALELCHAADAVALALLVSPLVWEYHYVMAIPCAVLAFAMRRRDRPWLVGLGAFLMFGLPCYNVFPFSYNRVAGLLVMLYLTSPGHAAEFARRGARPASPPSEIL